MMTMNTNHWSLFSRSAAAGLALLLGLTHPLPAVAKIKPDWSKVQAVPLGTPTTVVLYEDQAPLGKRKIKGHFHSATAGAITLLLPDGQTRALEKRAVRKVLVPRPLVERYQGWVTLGVALALVEFYVVTDRDPGDVGGLRLPLHAIVTLPVTLVAFFVAPKRGDTYNVPLKHRDNTAQTPPRQRSGTTIPGVTGAGEDPTGSGLADSFLTKLSGPEWLRHQARQALVRKGLPLHLPDLPVHGLSVERTGMRAGFDRGFPQIGVASRTDSLD